MGSPPPDWDRDFALAGVEWPYRHSAAGPSISPPGSVGLKVICFVLFTRGTVLPQYDQIALSSF